METEYNQAIIKYSKEYPRQAFLLGALVLLTFIMAIGRIIGAGMKFQLSVLYSGILLLIALIAIETQD